MSAEELPPCDDLFMKFFDRWYDGDDRKRKGFQATCPDSYSGVYKKGTPASQLTPLVGDTLKGVEAQVGRMVEAARSDWASGVTSRNPVSIEGIGDFDRHYDAARIRQVIDRSKPEEYDNDYVVLCIELGAVIGQVLRELRPGLEWVWEWPYWESYLWDAETSEQIKVFHWAIKKMSGYGVDDGLVAKLRVVASEEWRNQSKGQEPETGS